MENNKNNIKINILNKLKEKCTGLFNIIKKNKIYTLCFVIIISSILSIIIQYFEKQELVKINETKITPKDGKIAVYITGEIKKPGVYYLNEGMRIENVIDLAGGFSENANIDSVNLSKKVLDSDRIIIPKKQVETIYLDDEETKQEKNNKTDETNEQENQKKTTECVNINDASKDELMTLKGVGASTADKIISERKNGNFEDIEDLKKVQGIGEKKYDALKNSICVN